MAHTRCPSLAPEVMFLRLRVPGLRDRIRVAHLSDLYTGAATPLDLQVAAVQRVNDADPDLTVITGNHVARGLSSLDRLTGTLAGLESPAVAVLGPADRLAGGPAIAAALARAGITVLEQSRAGSYLPGPIGGRALLAVAASPASAPILWAQGVPLVLTGAPDRRYPAERSFQTGWSGDARGQLYANPGLGSPGVHRPAPRRVVILDLEGGAVQAPVERPWDFRQRDAWGSAA